MTVHVDGRVFKQFHAKDPITNSTHVKVRSSATAATDFLHEVLQRMPLRSVQIDGGSEFMQEFGTACRDARITLHVLRPAAPTITAASSATTAPCTPSSGPSTGATSDEVNRALDRSLRDHHNVRPRHALGLLTPAEFPRKLSMAT